MTDTPDEAADPRLAWQRLADTIRDEITSGQRPRGSLLPSMRELLERGYSDSTVKKVWTVLAGEGLIERQQGRGVVVASNTPRRAPTVEELAERIARLEALLAEHLQEHEKPRPPHE